MLRLIPTTGDYAGLRRSWKSDLIAGVTVGVVALPLALAFGISSGVGAAAGLITAVVAGLVAAIFVVGDVTSAATPWWVGACLVVAGVGIAPALAVMFAMTSASVKFSETAEAYGWIGTGQLIGAALGSAIAGFLIDGVGHAGAYAAAAGFAIVGALVAVVFVRGFPDLRGRDASPIPDTEPVPVIT